MSNTAERAKIAELVDTGKRAWGLVNTNALLKRGRTEPLPRMRSVICVYAAKNHNMTSRQVSEALGSSISAESIRQFCCKHDDKLKYDKEYAELWSSFLTELDKETVLIQ